MAEKIDIRGVKFDNVTFDETIDIIVSKVNNGEQCAVFTPNSEIVQSCIDTPELYDVINSAELIIPDGIGVIKASKILKTPLKEKVAGVEVGEKVLEKASENSWKVFFLGGKPGVAEIAKEKMELKYPGLNVCGTNDGYFAKEGEENKKVIEKINNLNPDVLYVCLGAPTQEKWIYNNRAQILHCKLFLGLGGSLDIYSETAKRAPKFFVKLGLEWFYRLLCNPSRIGRMMKLPKFYFGTIKYKNKNKTKN